jgi:hypothetical protein
VAGLVLRAATEAGRKIEIVEWPGEKPVRKTIRVAPAVFKKIVAGRKSVPLAEPVKLGEIGCLPWGSIVTLAAGELTLPIATGPAKYQNGWVLPVLDLGTVAADGKSVASAASRFVRDHGLASRSN